MQSTDKYLDSLWSPGPVFVPVVWLTIIVFELGTSSAQRKVTFSIQSGYFFFQGVKYWIRMLSFSLIYLQIFYFYFWILTIRKVKTKAYFTKRIGLINSQNRTEKKNSAQFRRHGRSEKTKHNFLSSVWLFLIFYSILFSLFKKKVKCLFGKVKLYMHYLSIVPHLFLFFSSKTVFFLFKTIGFWEQNWLWAILKNHFYKIVIQTWMLHDLSIFWFMSPPYNLFFIWLYLIQTLFRITNVFQGNFTSTKSF